MALRGVEAPEEAGDYGVSRLYSSSVLITVCGISEWGKLIQSKLKYHLLVNCFQTAVQFTSKYKSNEYVIIVSTAV